MWTAFNQLTFSGTLQRSTMALLGPPPRFSSGGRSHAESSVAVQTSREQRLLLLDRFSVDVRRVCRSHCDLCRPSRDGTLGDPLAFMQPATEALNHGAWKTIEVSCKQKGGRALCAVHAHE